jgi:tyrosyl-tRNA synthetase
MPPEMANNYDWFKEISFLDFIRDTGKHITVNYMMAKDSVKKRLEGETGMSFTEFTYQLVQGYDFYWLYQNKNCKITNGRQRPVGKYRDRYRMIRRKCGGEAFAFTCPLIKKADGGKFGKTEQGNIWLDPAKTSPYQFYQFWLNATIKMLKNGSGSFLFLTNQPLIISLQNRKGRIKKDIAKKALAKEVTIFVQALMNTTRLLKQQKNYSATRMPRPKA